MERQYILALLITVLAGLSTLVGGFFTFFVKKDSNQQQNQTGRQQLVQVVHVLRVRAARREKQAGVAEQ